MFAEAFFRKRRIYMSVIEDIKEELNSTDIKLMRFTFLKPILGFSPVLLAGIVGIIWLVVEGLKDPNGGGFLIVFAVILAALLLIPVFPIIYGIGGMIAYNIFFKKKNATGMWIALMVYTILTGMYYVSTTFSFVFQLLPEFMERFMGEPVFMIGALVVGVLVAIMDLFGIIFAVIHTFMIRKIFRISRRIRLAKKYGAD